MKRVMCFWVLLLASFNAVSEVNINSGNYLLDLYRQYKKGHTAVTQDPVGAMQRGLYMGYVQGVGNSLNYFAFCAPHEVTYQQLYMVVGNFLEAHPERLHEHRSGLVIDALSKAFPCKDKKL